MPSSEDLTAYSNSESSNRDRDCEAARIAKSMTKLQYERCLSPETGHLAESLLQKANAALCNDKIDRSTFTIAFEALEKLVERSEAASEKLACAEEEAEAIKKQLEVIKDETEAAENELRQFKCFLSIGNGQARFLDGLASGLKLLAKDATS